MTTCLSMNLSASTHTRARAHTHTHTHTHTHIFHNQIRDYVLNDNPDHWSIPSPTVFFFLICFYLTEKINKGTQINHVIEYVENFYMGSRFNCNWNKSTKILQIFLTKEERNMNLHICCIIFTREYTYQQIFTLNTDERISL